MRWLGKSQRSDERAQPALHAGLDAQTLSLLEGLPSDWAILGPYGRVVAASTHFEGLGLLRRGGLTMPELSEMVSMTQADGRLHTGEFAIGGVEFGAPPRTIRVRTASLDAELVMLLIDDISSAVRVDAMRRDFIATVSHELISPVASVERLVRNMRAKQRDAAVVESTAKEIESQARHLGALVSDLTDLSRLQSADSAANAEPTLVSDPSEQAVAGLRLDAQSKRIDITIDVDPRLAVLVQSEQLVTAVRNVVANAITYSEPHTLVCIRAVRVDGYAEISVSDQGIGMSRKQQARIFERFYRVDPARSRETGGTGLGLAIVEHICESHGGEVLVESAPGLGSTFTLRFPACAVVAAGSQEVS